MKINKVYLGDWTNNQLEDKSVQLIIADPPYFEVKGEFDFIWKSFDDYLKDVEKWAIECKRILADNGTLFWYGDKKKIAYSQIIFDKYFNLENSLVWRKKDSMQYQYYSPDLARSFNTHNERILMYSNEINLTGLELINKELIKPINPFAKELKKARLEKGVSINAVAEYGKFYGNVNHGGAVTNWERGYNIPNREQWKILCDNLPILRTEYDDLRKEYEDKRRYFYNPNKLDEVLEFSQEGHITRKYNHETKKPETLTRALILTCSRKNDLVLVPFAGSGTECAMSAKEGRNYIGFDINKKYVDMANKRCKEHKKQLRIF